MTASHLVKSTAADGETSTNDANSGGAQPVLNDINNIKTDTTRGETSTNDSQ